MTGAEEWKLSMGLEDTVPARLSLTPRLVNSFMNTGRLAGQLREAMSAASGRPMIQPEPSLWLGSQSRWLGLLLLLLSLLGITWTEVQPPQPKQDPTLQATTAPPHLRSVFLGWGHPQLAMAMSQEPLVIGLTFSPGLQP
uniref:C-type lectin domain family 18, member A n=1 Tax=Mus musculus TaxID=10090 RepID=A0A087WPI3_MOUSE